MKESQKKTLTSLNTFKTRLELVNGLLRTCPGFSNFKSLEGADAAMCRLLAAIRAVGSSEHENAVERLQPVLDYINATHLKLTESLGPVLHPGDQFPSGLKILLSSLRVDLVFIISGLKDQYLGDTKQGGRIK
ncbi:hypothetical protein [Vibrio phage vB_ValS_PJ32]|nr:hypothetical protein [Vibrio phage vB_ValS_PJ32]